MKKRYLEKTSVYCCYGKFFTLEIPVSQLNTERANAILRSWSYDTWLFYDRKAATAFLSGHISEAVGYWCNAFLAIDKAPTNDPRLRVTLENLIEAHMALRDLEVAEDFAERSLQLNKILFGENHENVKNCHTKLADIYYRRQKYKEALREITEANRISKLQTIVTLPGIPSGITIPPPQPIR